MLLRTKVEVGCWRKEQTPQPSCSVRGLPSPYPLSTPRPSSASRCLCSTATSLWGPSPIWRTLMPLGPARAAPLALPYGTTGGARCGSAAYRVATGWNWPLRSLPQQRSTPSTWRHGRRRQRASAASPLCSTRPTLGGRTSGPGHTSSRWTTPSG